MNKRSVLAAALMLGMALGISGAAGGGAEDRRHSLRSAIRGAFFLEGHGPSARREGDGQGGLQGRTQDSLGVGSRLRGRCVRSGRHGPSGARFRRLCGGGYLRAPLVHEAGEFRSQETDRLPRQWGHRLDGGPHGRGFSRNDVHGQVPLRISEAGRGPRPCPS